jgi:2-phosphosulfolactate phosphatase
MKLDVLLTPGEPLPADVADRTVVVIDVLRASSTIVEALAAGARALFPVATIEEALRLANTLGREDVLLCGERKALPIEGFDLGNSPPQFTRRKVSGKTLVMSTTNGTATMVVAAAGARVLIGSFLNFTAVVKDLVQGGAQPVFVCSGREGRFGVDDAVLAGRFAAALLAARPDEAWELNDGATAAVALAERHKDVLALFRGSAAGKQIVEAGLGDDLAFCARVDRHKGIVPVLHDRQIRLEPTLAPTPAAASEA